MKCICFLNCKVSFKDIYISMNHNQMLIQMDRKDIFLLLSRKSHYFDILYKLIRSILVGKLGKKNMFEASRRNEYLQGIIRKILYLHSNILASYKKHKYFLLLSKVNLKNNNNFGLLCYKPYFQGKKDILMTQYQNGY